jgi:hypothetical protein
VNVSIEEGIAISKIVTSYVCEFEYVCDSYDSCRVYKLSVKYMTGLNIWSYTSLSLWFLT